MFHAPSQDYTKVPHLLYKIFCVATILLNIIVASLYANRNFTGIPVNITDSITNITTLQYNNTENLLSFDIFYATSSFIGAILIVELVLLITLCSKRREQPTVELYSPDDKEIPEICMSTLCIIVLSYNLSLMVAVVVNENNKKLVGPFTILFCSLIAVNVYAFLYTLFSMCCKKPLTNTTVNTAANTEANTAAAIAALSAEIASVGAEIAAVNAEIASLQFIANATLWTSTKPEVIFDDKDENECVICNTNIKNVIFACGHYTCCSTCITRINKKCPVCRSNICPMYMVKQNTIQIV